MAKLAITVVAAEQNATLVVDLPPSPLGSALLEAVQARLLPLAQAFNLPEPDKLLLHLHRGAVDGPLLDPEDLLPEDTANGNEVIFAVVHNQSKV